MADIEWTGTSGSWTDAANWTPQQVPGATDTVTVSGSVAADILIGGSDSVAAAGILLNDAAGTLEVDGLLTAGTIELTAGTIHDYGTIAGATIVDDGGTLDFGYGLLQGDTIVGTLDVGSTATAVVQQGLTVQDASGAPGTITIDGADSTLLFNDTETFDNATIVVGSATGLDNLEAGGTLTLGQGVLVETTDDFNYDTLGGNGPIINEGSILADAPGGTLAIESPNFVNDGDITVADGADLAIQPFGTFANNGRLAITSGGTIAVQYLNGFVNTGSIQIGAGSELDFNTYASALTQAQTIGGTIEIDGLVNADGETLTVDATGAFSELDNYGTLENATLLLSGGTLGLDDASVFQNDTIVGTLTIGDGDAVIIQGGFGGITNADGTPGTIALTGADATLEVADTETIDNATIIIGNAGDLDTLQADGTLTLGVGATVTTAGSITTDMITGAGTVINDGSILADGTGGTLVLETTDFDNDGAMTVNGGQALEIEVFGTFANDGRFAITNGSTVTLEDASAFLNTGSIQVGTGSELDLYDYAPSMSQGQTAGGTLEIDGVVDAGGNTIASDATGAFSELDNYGTLENATLLLSGGTLGLDDASVFQNDTIVGTLTIGDGDAVIIQGGFGGITNADGTPGTIALTGADATLEVADTETIDNATIIIGNAGDLDTLQADGTLTLGVGATVMTAGSITTDMITGAGTVINDGSILADGTSGTLVLETTDFDNDGAMTANGGQALEIEVFGTFANDGRFAITNGSTVTLEDASAFLNTGSIQVGTGSELDLYDYAPSMSQGQTAGGTLEIDGVVDAGGNTIASDATGAFSELDNYGTLENATLLLSGGTLGLDDASVFQNDTIVGTLTIGDGDAVIIQGGFGGITSADGTPGTIALTGADATLEVADTETIDNAVIVIGNAGDVDTLQVDTTLTIGAHAKVVTTATSVSDAITGAGTVLNGGTVAADAASGNLIIGTTDFTNDGLVAASGGAGLEIQTFDAFRNDGTLSITDGSSGTIDAVNTFVNAGTIVIDNGTLTVNAVLDGTDGGLSTLGHGAQLELGAGATSDQTISFLDGTDSLVLDDVSDFAGAVRGFQSGDQIVLDGFAGATESYADGVLTFTKTGTVLGQTIVTTGTIDVQGTYRASDFTTASDANGDLILTTDVLPCFVAGTRILTMRGEIAVEELAVGDEVVVVTDGTRRPSPIVWIGRRAVDIRRHPAPEKVRPVRVQRGAFGAGLPQRDLLLSPDHAVFGEGVLVPVKYLLNGTTIRVEANAKSVAYFHVELAQHEVILSEGLPTESYLGVGGDAKFENGGLPVVLHPDFSHVTWDVLSCAPLKVTGVEVDRLRERLAGTASDAAAKALRAG